MEKLALSDIRGPRLYETFRDDFRKKLIELKKPRRVSVGDRVTLVFENRATLIFQVEEMLRAETITEPDKIQAEIDVYNTLIPGPGQLSATLFLEIPPGTTNVKEELHRFVGLDEHVLLVIGPDRVRAEFEPGRQEMDRISAVQYVRFTLPASAQQALKAGAPASIVLDHPNYQHEQPLSVESRQSLAADLA